VPEDYVSPSIIEIGRPDKGSDWCGISTSNIVQFVIAQVGNGKKFISSLKIRTWVTMPLKGYIIATFRGLLSDCSPLERGGCSEIAL
jgi:hypothetical protein